MFSGRYTYTNKLALVTGGTAGIGKAPLIDTFDCAFGMEGEVRDSIASRMPIGRVGASEQIAAAVLYHCPDEAKSPPALPLLWMEAGRRNRVRM